MAVGDLMEEFTLETYNSTSPTTTSIMTMVTTLVTGLAMVSLLPLLLLSIKHWINHQQVSTYLQFPCPGSTRILLRFSGYYWKYFINNNTFYRMLTPRNRKKFVIWWRRGGRRQCWWTGSLAGCSPPASYCSTSSTGLCSGTTTSGDQLHLVKLTWTLLQQSEKIRNNRFNFYSNISTVVIKVPCQKLYSSKFMSL